MRIVSVAARTIRWSIASRGAARGRTERAAVVIEARTDRGVVGLGEAAPLPGMSPDTLEDAERAIAAFAQGAPFELADRGAAHALAAASSLAASSLAATASPSARFAIETALLDALARDHGIALAALLGSSAGGAGRLPLAAVVDDPETARRAFAAGIRCLKIKLGPGDDPGRVRVIAAAVPGARLRIDANRSWPRAEVAARLAALADLPIDYVEEPCVEAHLLLAGPLPGRLALDESLAVIAPDELRAALRSPALAAFVLKPTLLGGLSTATSLAELARCAGVAAIVSHGLEGPVGTAACAELALALGGDHPAGLAAHPALAGWSIEVGQLAADHVHGLAAAGLGFADLDLAGVVTACGARTIENGADQP
jgi:L-alanine-DL-glutamate epimerase-like enolase superfamily enzyme